MVNQNILDSIYEARIEEICRLSNEEKAVYNECLNNTDDFVDNIDENIRTQVEEYIEAKIEKINFMNAIANKKYYKAGLADGIKIMNEALNIRNEEELK